MKEIASFFIALILAVAALVGVAYLSGDSSDRGYARGVSEMCEQAVARGYAEWKVIGPNETEFVWKLNAPSKDWRCPLCKYQEPQP